MSFSSIVLTFLSLILWLYFLWSRRRFYKAAWQLRGPIGLPFIGLGLKLMNPETFLQYIAEIAKIYKTPFISWMGTNCFLYVNDPETVEQVFNSPHCTNKGVFYRFLSSAIGDGLFTSNSPRWNKHRRLINPAFSRQIINNFLPIFNAEADELVRKFQIGAAEGRKLEVYEILKRSVLEAACQTTMGKKMNFQNDGSAAIFKAYNGITEVCVKRMLSPWLYPDVIYRYSALYLRQQKVVNVLFNFVENLLAGNKTELKQQHQQKVQNQQHQTSANMNCDILNQITAVKHEDKQMKEQAQDLNIGKSRKSKDIFVEQVGKYVDEGHFTWTDVRDEANVIIAATFETTSTALYLVCLCLAMHPEYQDKLYEELVNLFPDVNNDSENAALDDEVNNNNNSKNISSNNNNNNNNEYNTQKQHKNVNPTHYITHADLERMTYTDMVINEAMRLFAPVPIVLRSVSSDFQLRNGVVIPEGTQIGIDIFNMQRNEDVWGPDARAFRPEKHFGINSTKNINNNSDSANVNGFGVGINTSTFTTNQQHHHHQHHPFAFVPFTKGLRMCIGYRYALMLMKVMLAKIFRNYRLSTDAKIDDLTIKGTISLKLREYPLCELVQR